MVSTLLASIGAFSLGVIPSYILGYRKGKRSEELDAATSMETSFGKSTFRLVKIIPNCVGCGRAYSLRRKTCLKCELPTDGQIHVHVKCSECNLTWSELHPNGNKP